MPGEDFLISNDGDLVDDGEGFFEVTKTAQPAVRHMVLDELGAWIGDITNGRTKRGIAGRNSTDAELEEESDSIRVALEVLEDEALIADIKLTTDRDQVNRFVVVGESTDTQSGGTLRFDSLGEFGDV